MHATADSLSPLGIRNWLAAKAAEIAPSLPQMSAVRVSVGSYEAKNCVIISGFHDKTRRLLTFSASTIEETVKKAADAVAKL
jgi:hypothetical protein